MAISYSGLTNYGKASLPSVSSWGTNNNILKDPTRSITTRRIDKVTDNSFLVQEVDCSSDRIADSIMVYPRGINPMVSVSYTDFTGGVGKGQALIYRGVQGKLPYRVADRGAFRPPILPPVDLLPLSRMPRNVTKIDPIIYNPDYTKKTTCGPEARTTKDILNVSVDGVRRYQMKKEQHAMYVGNVTKEITPLFRDGIVKYDPIKIQREGYVRPMMKNVPKGELQTNIAGIKRTIQISNAPTLKPSLKASANSAISGRGTRQISPEIVNLRPRAVIYPSFEGSDKISRTKDIKPEFISRAKETPLKVDVQTSLAKNFSGGLSNEISREMKPSRRRGGIIMPDNFNVGFVPPKVNQDVNFSRNRQRLLPEARPYI